jgi:hypothetical protein
VKQPVACNTDEEEKPPEVEKGRPPEVEEGKPVDAEQPDLNSWSSRINRMSRLL